MSAGDALFDGSIDGISAVGAGGGEGDDRAIGQNIAGAIVNGFGLDYDSGFVSLAGDAEAAGIGGNLLQDAARFEVIKVARTWIGPADLPDEVRNQAAPFCVRTARENSDASLADN